MIKTEWGSFDHLRAKTEKNAHFYVARVSSLCVDCAHRNGSFAPHRHSKPCHNPIKSVSNRTQNSPTYARSTEAFEPRFPEQTCSRTDQNNRVLYAEKIFSHVSRRNSTPHNKLQNVLQTCQ